MKWTSWVGLLLASLLTTPACERERGRAASSAMPDGAPPSGLDVPWEAEQVPIPAASSFDPGGYAGTFGAPHTRLRLRADGSFTLEQGAARLSGEWTLQRDGAHLVLVPGSDGEPARRYELVGHDELRQVGGESQRLRRLPGQPRR